MKLSTKSRYGLRAMIYLAAKAGNGSVQLNDIAASENISEKYLEQIIPYLKTAKLITAKRGMTGGYEIAMPAEKITLRMIIDALEGGFELSECYTNKYCARKNTCAALEIWNELGDMITNYFDSVTLARAAAIYHEKNNTAGNMYHI